jgi:hypothetical protein
MPKIKVVGIGKKDSSNLFAVGSQRGEFYFITPPQDSKARKYFDEIYAQVELKKTIEIEASLNGRNAQLILPSILEAKLEEVEPSNISDIKVVKQPSGNGDIYRLHDVVLNYHNNPPKAVFIEPWNNAGDIFYLHCVISNYNKDENVNKKISSEFREIVKSWKWVLNVGSRDVFYEYCSKTPPIKEIKMADGWSRYDTSDDSLRDRIFKQVVSEKIDLVCKTANSQNVDLVLMGLFTPFNGKSYGGGIGDLCDLNEGGVDVVNELRNRGYKGNIVAVKAYPYSFPDNPFNRGGLLSLFNKGVVLSPSTQKETLQQILLGGKFSSDYRLD